MKEAALRWTVRVWRGEIVNEQGVVREGSKGRRWTSFETPGKPETGDWPCVKDKR